YGRHYLTEDEFTEQLDERLRIYHRYLAKNFIFGRRSSDFWKYHKGRLAELGYPLGRLALFKAAVLAALSWLADPAHAIEKLREVRAPQGAKHLETNAATQSKVSSAPAALSHRGI